jgi:flagellar hook-associated protein 1 FlgK
MSEFGSINTALSGLIAARAALETTGQNVSNANTPGYVRESVVQSAVGGPVIPAMYASTNGIGQGVSMDGVSRAADSYLDQRSLGANSVNANLTQTQTIMQQVETGFNEPGTSGLSSQLSTFWSSWDTMSHSPADAGTRAAVVGAASNLAATFNQVASNITSVRANASANALSSVAQINTDAAQIASLNHEIVSATGAGISPSGLLDQRDQLVQSLGALVGATTRAGQNGSVDVYVGTNALVRGSTSGSISAAVNTAGNVALTWDIDKSAVAAGGTIGAQVVAVNSTLPNLLSGPNGLDSIAASVAAAANGAQAGGVYWTENTSTTPSTWASAAGPAMFADTSGGPVTAAGMIISPGISAATLAASAPPPTGGPTDGSNAQLTAENGATVNAQYRGYIGNLGSQVAQINNQVTVQGQVAQQVNTARSSSEGVNLDEEMTHMVQFQQAYTASAKFLNVVDQTLQTLMSVIQ